MVDGAGRRDHARPARRPGDHSTDELKGEPSRDHGHPPADRVSRRIGRTTRGAQAPTPDGRVVVDSNPTSESKPTVRFDLKKVPPEGSRVAGRIRRVEG